MEDRGASSVLNSSGTARILQRHSSHRQDRETPNPEATVPHYYGETCIFKLVTLNTDAYSTAKVA